MIKIMYSCAFGPKLYKIYQTRKATYEPQIIERLSDNILTVVSYMFSIGLYTSPFIAMMAYRRGYTMAEVKSLGIYATGFGIFVMLTFVMRGIGRARNHRYVEFIKTFKNAKLDNEVYMTRLRNYDFDFKFWPVNFNMPKSRIVPKADNISMRSESNTTTAVMNAAEPPNSDLPMYQSLLLKTLSWLAVKTFALRLIYPGSLSIIQTLLWQPLVEGRSELVIKHNGQRAKLKAVDGNEIDTMLVKKSENSAEGKTLVICSEGNSGFYEIGLMGTAIKAGYSTLGWNHPGFAGSTGIPYPEQEQNAIDVVVQYALSLGFKSRNIVLFGWSIGGYTSTWAAVQYPYVKGLVLDATFDDLLPLAENQMPKSWKRLVIEVIRSYVDLNIAQLLEKYKGPVKLVRRTEDEIISLIPGNITTNRGNNLMLKLVESRFYVLPREQKKFLKKYISLRDAQKNKISATVPLDIMPLVHMVNKTMSDYDSTHCTPLPADIFNSIVKSLPIR